MFEEQKERVHKVLHDESGFIGRFAAQAEAKTKISRERLAAGLAGVVVLYLLFGYGTKLACNFVGCVYPAYCSLKALESPSPDDDKKWLTYWIVFSCFSFAEFFIDLLLWWLPAYFLIKMVFLIFLMFPGTYNGSLILYEKVIRPLFLKHESKIDAAMKTAETGVFWQTAGRSAFKETVEQAGRVAIDEALATKTGDKTA